MNTRFLLLGLSMIYSWTTYGHSEITYIERDGVMWITPKYVLATYALRPMSFVPEFQCQRAYKFLNDDQVLKQCRKDLASCDNDTIDLLREEARRLSFGDSYDENGKIEDYAKIDWKISTSELNGLEPDRLEEYASMLSIDPQRSVVAKFERNGMVMTTSPGKSLFFEGHIEGKDISNSWFLQNRLEMLPMGDYADIFLGANFEKPDTIQVRGAFLNCDMASKGEYIDVAYNGTMVGYIPVSKRSRNILWRAYSDLQDMEMPGSITSIERAILYGYELGRATSELNSNRLSANYITGKFFDTSNDQVKLNVYSSKSDLASDLSKAYSYKERGSLIRLVHGRLAVDSIGDTQ